MAVATSLVDSDGMRTGWPDLEEEKKDKDDGLAKRAGRPPVWGRVSSIGAHMQRGRPR